MVSIKFSHSQLPPRSLCSFQPYLFTHIFYCFIIITIVLIFASSSFATADSRKKEKEKIGQKIQMQEMNVIHLHAGIKKEKNNINATKVEEKGLLEKLEKVELQLHNQKAKLADFKLKMVEQEKLIINKERELHEVLTQKRAAQLHLQKRISAYYKLDRVSLVNISFSARTLPDILFFHDSFQTLLTYDQDLINSYRTTIDELGRTREALTLEDGLLQEFMSRADKEREAIAQSKAELENLLSHIRTQKMLYTQAIVEYKKEEKKLSSSLSLLKQKEELLEQEFRLSQGTLPMPVKGTILSYFGQVVTNNLGISKKSTGISITSPDGTPVKALFKGTIFFSGYLRGYGNTVIVHHGYQYYSVISRVERLLKKKGAKVQQGDIIAVMGDTAMLVEDGIQLEIRHGAKNLDPLSWIDKKFITEK